MTKLVKWQSGKMQWYLIIWNETKERISLWVAKKNQNFEHADRFACNKYQNFEPTPRFACNKYQTLSPHTGLPATNSHLQRGSE